MAVAALFILGVIGCVFLNLLVVVVLSKKGKDINYMDIIMISLSISDLFQAGIGYAIEIYSFYLENEISHMRCQIAGFTITFLGLVSISHLVGIAVERYFILKYPVKARVWIDKPAIALYVIIPGWLYGFVWAVLPLVGWSSYKREDGDKHRCGIDILNRDANHVTYSYNLMVWCFILPVLVIAYCCHFCWGQLKMMGEQAEALGVAERIVEQRKELSRKQSIMSLVLIGTFLFAWTPYAVCVLVATAKAVVPKDLQSFASVFAKCSALYNPIIYSVFSKDFRDRSKKLFGCVSTPAPVRFHSVTMETGSTAVTAIKNEKVDNGSTSLAVTGTGEDKA